MVIRRTDDGGASWTTLYRNRHWFYDTRLHFTDRLHGWATSEETDQGFTWGSLYRTDDGGRSWRSVRYPAFDFPSAFTGPGTAWAGDEASGLLWRTTNGARSWSFRVRPELACPCGVEGVDRNRLIISSTAGMLQSSDRGHSWRSIPGPSSPRGFARLRHEPAYVGIVQDHEVNKPEISRDGGRNWAALHLPKRNRYRIGDVQFTDPEHGLLAAGDASDGDYGELPVYTTADGGKTWRQVRVPRTAEDSVTLAPNTILITPGEPATGRAPLFISADGGSHWIEIRLPRNGLYWQCSASRPDPAAIWVLCTPMEAQTGSVLMRSNDGGKTWRRLSTKEPLDPILRALDGREAWASTKGIDDPTVPVARNHALWHTTDGGRTWREVWPDLQGWTVERDIRDFGPDLPPR